MRIGSNLPIAVNNSGDRSQMPSLAEQFHEQRSASSEALPPSAMQDFERIASEGVTGERFFKIDELSATAQQALSAYQATESLASNNPRNQLIGIDVYA